MVGDIFRQEFPESLELSGRWSQLLVEGEKQRNVIFIHRDTLSTAANILLAAGLWFYHWRLAERAPFEEQGVL